MDKEQYQTAKAHLVACMQQGQVWQQASASAGSRISQSNAYRLMHAVRRHGEAALKDGRHDHPIKLCGEARAFLEDACRKAPHTPSSTVQKALRERFALNVSVSQINRVRAVDQQEREMYELDNCKDQVMTVCKVALANLGMWVRDQWFPAGYAHASWHRLQVFFQLPGRIFWGRDLVEVELKRFNDRALTRDLEMLCAKVAQGQLCLPDGRRLLFRMQGTNILHLDAQEKEVA